MCKSKLIKRLLVPATYSKAGQDLLSYAGQLASVLGAEILLLKTSQTSELTFTQQNRGIQEMRSFGERVFSQLRLLDNKSVSFDCVIRPGKLSECVVSVVQDYHIDLTLMETCTLHTDEKAKDEEHAAAIMEKVACPVMVVPCTARFQKIEKLVFATDFTDQEDAVIERIVSFAKQVGAALTFVQVYNRSERNQLGNYKTAMLELQQQLAGEQVNLKLLEEEDILEGISDFAELTHADMLLLATQDSYLMQRLFSSNYIKAMAYHTRFPILTFRQFKKKPCSGMCANCTSKKSSIQELSVVSAS